MQAASWLVALVLVTITTFANAAQTTIYYHLDALGSPVAATDKFGNLEWREEYRPYGERIQNQAAAQTNSRWYTGHAHDNATGLTYAGARYYDPVVGRFMGVDPVGFAETNIQTFNRYAYGNNNPYKYVDPDGRAAETALDLISLGLSINEYRQNPSFWSGVGVAIDAIGTVIPFVPAGVGTIRQIGKVDTEIVQRAMSRDELRSIEQSGELSRGGREGPFHASDAINSDGQRARERLSLEQTPEVRVTLEVPKGVFSSPSKVAPKHNMPGGGKERTAPGEFNIPAKVRGVHEY
jgi:RHS repeat-associated protein